MTATEVVKFERAYHVAGIRPDQSAPAELQEMAARAEMVVASDLPRAIESQRHLAPTREPVIVPLLREIRLEPPH